MIITAKFASLCPCCSTRIEVGDKVEWQKGEKARHAECPAVAVPAAKPAPKAKAKADTTGCEYYSRRSIGRNDTYEVGQVLYLTRTSTYVTVVSVDRKWRDDDSDEWMVGCYARPATAEEIAPVAARRAATLRREAIAAAPAWVASQVRGLGQSTADRIPADAWRLSVGARLGGSETLYATEGALWLVVSSYDDAPRTWRMPITSAAIEAMATALESVTG